jgi:hypothetical protein
MFMAFLMFGAMYLIMGSLIRLFTLKFPDTKAAQALMFAH